VVSCSFRSSHYGGPEANFTSFVIGDGYLNIIAQPAGRHWSWWGRLILYVSDVDALYEQAIQAGLSPEAPPEDAEWGERYFMRSLTLDLT